MQGQFTRNPDGQQSSATVLRHLLSQPATLSYLLDVSNWSNPKVLTEGGLWTRLPQYYLAPRPRASFKVESLNGDRFLVKLNTETQRIDREVKALQLLSTRTSSHYRAPIVADAEIEDRNDRGMPCGWLIEHWNEGKAISPRQPALLTEAAEALAELHAPEFDPEIFRNQYQMALPSPARLASQMHERQLQEVRAGLLLSTGSLTSELALVEHEYTKHAAIEILRLVHGDFHFNNILSEEGSEQSPPMIIDWEDASIDNPLSDVAHLMVMSDFEAGSEFKKQYLGFARSWLNEDVMHHANRIIWRYAGFWIARMLKWKLGNLHTEHEKATTCSEMATVLMRLVAET